jgi:hypothetical protein
MRPRHSPDLIITIVIVCIAITLTVVAACS